MQRCEPRTQQRAANQLVQLLNVDLSGDIEDKTLSWERMIHTYEEQTRKICAEDLRVGVWLSNAPESTLKTHMLMRTELVRWADFRAELISCTRIEGIQWLVSVADGPRGLCQGLEGRRQGQERRWQGQERRWQGQASNQRCSNVLEVRQDGTLYQ